MDVVDQEDARFNIRDQALAAKEVLKFPFVDTSPLELPFGVGVAEVQLR